MRLPTTTPAATSPAKATVGSVDMVSLPKMQHLLTQAAQMAASAGIAPEAFAHTAWHAYLSAFPDLAVQVADAQFAATLEQLRSQGRLAKA